MLELAEEALNKIALAVDAAADGALDHSLAGGRNMSPSSAGSDHVQEGIGVVTTVGHNITAFEPLEQKWRGTQIVGLPRG
ncbi:MAG: hypothetical protein E6515_14620 [Enterococcus faecalis]|nr:hypothetical protein [uncultured Bradyrhizobium sp.]MDU6568839.1 hypothetical protein [Enterococcus faecalis]